VAIWAHSDVVFSLSFLVAECADIFGNVPMLRAEEELILQLGMTEGTEFLWDPMLFAVGSGIGRREGGGPEPRPGGPEVRPQGGDADPCDGKDAEGSQRSKDYPLHVLIS